MKNTISYVLSKLDITPILVDIGASGAPPEIWEPIAKRSVYVGFDPDLRDLREISNSKFVRAVTVNEAVTSATDKIDVLFYLTSSPHCSSTLEPEKDALAEYLFADLFAVEKKVHVRATSLDEVIKRLGLPGIDWLKIDSQGTDLRILNSLRDELRSRVLAVDIEPGLIDAYQGEDLFVEAHQKITRDGFWLSDIQVKGTVRMRRSTLKEVLLKRKNITERSIKNVIKDSPGWCEARYLRTIDSMKSRQAQQRDYVLLWAFALLDGQIGFALDLALEYKKTFGKDNVSSLLWEEALSLTRRRFGLRSIWSRISSLR